MFHPLRLSLLGLWFLIATGFAETPEQGFQRFARAMKAGDKAAVTACVAPYTLTGKGETPEQYAESLLKRGGDWANPKIGPVAQEGDAAFLRVLEPRRKVALTRVNDKWLLASEEFIALLPKEKQVVFVQLELSLLERRAEAPAADLAAKAKTDVKNLHKSILMYALEYGKPPAIPVDKDGRINTVHLLHVLTAEGGEGTPNAKHALNPRQIKFWGAPAGGSLDPWGKQYHVAFDPDSDGKIKIGGVEVNSETAAVWSSGPNGKDEQGAGDDVVSWK